MMATNDRQQPNLNFVHNCVHRHSHCPFETFSPSDSRHNEWLCSPVWSDRHYVWPKRISCAEKMFVQFRWSAIRSVVDVTGGDRDDDDELNGGNLPYAMDSVSRQWVPSEEWHRLHRSLSASNWTMNLYFCWIHNDRRAVSFGPDKCSVVTIAHVSFRHDRWCECSHKCCYRSTPPDWGRDAWMPFPKCT